MSATASDSNSYQPADTQGLEALFEEQQPKELPGNSFDTDQDAGNDLGCAKGIAQWLTVEEAARRLSISPNAVIKRLGKGKLDGRKVPGQFGEKWMINSEAVPQEVTVEFSEEQEVPGDSFGTARSKLEQPVADQGIAQKSLEVLAEVIRQQTEQIKLQNDVIKHLSEQIQDRDHKLKLLTDSKHQQGWWTQFCSWLMGQKA